MTDRLTFPRSHRLGGKREFSAVFDERTRESAGPLTVYSRPNGLKHLRLGISISRRVGTAVKRNRIKRLLRESFRLSQHEWPGGYDLVVVVRPHEVMELAAYQGVMVDLVARTDERWRKRGCAGS